MRHCDGSVEIFFGRIQGACGSVKDHNAHDFTDADKVCPGGGPWAVADCGWAVDHDEHPLTQAPDPVNEGDLR
jgi:hypothetical protein